MTTIAVVKNKPIAKAISMRPASDFDGSINQLNMWVQGIILICNFITAPFLILHVLARRKRRLIPMAIFGFTADKRLVYAIFL